MNDLANTVDSLLGDTLDRMERRGKIARLQEAIENQSDALGEDPFPLEHVFVPGVYARTIIAPQGALVVTKIHKTEHLIFMLKGDVSVLSEEGVTRLTAPCMFISLAGTKRVVYIHEETQWVNVHANPDDETDIGIIEQRVIASDYSEFPLEDKKCLG